MPFDLKRTFIIFGLVLTLLLPFALVTFGSRSAHAADPAYAAADPTYAWIGKGVWDNIKNRISGLWGKITCATNVTCWVRQATTSILNYGIYGLIGTDVLEIPKASTPAEAFADGYGLVGGLAMTAGGIYENPPDIHLARFFKAELSENLLASPTYATFGTELLGPIRDSWTVMRKLAYAIFVVVVGAISLMIILKKQLPTRAVVTATHAIPKIFFSLILITLSFPIVALFIDLFIVWLPQVLYNEFFTPPVDPAAGIGGLPADQPFIVLFGGGAVQFILGVIKIASSEGVGAALGTLAALILILIIAIAAVCVIGLIVLQLLYRYARILILAIFAPLLLLLGALPGQEGAISTWLKDLAVSTLVFPGILVVAFIAFSVLNETSYLPITKLGEIPGVGPIFMGGPIPSLSGSIICLILLLMSFKVPGIIESAVKGKR